MRNDLRILIHPGQDAWLYTALIEILDAAVVNDPEHYSRVKDKPGVVDHYGYHDNLRSAVVLSNEYGFAYDRLTIREIKDPVHEALRLLVAQHYGLSA